MNDTVIATPVEKTKAFYEARRVRHGKTRKDHASGSWKQRFANRALREEWQKNRSATANSFPGLGKQKK
jgi:hypothetical protein